MKELAGRTALVPGGRAGTIVAGLTVETHVAAAVAHKHDVFGSLDTRINEAALRSEAAFGSALRSPQARSNAANAPPAWSIGRQTTQRHLLRTSSGTTARRVAIN